MLGWVLLAAAAVVTFGWLWSIRRVEAAQPKPAPARAVKEAVSIHRPLGTSVEGLEIQYGPRDLVRSVRVGAMNDEHKELLLTMDAKLWRTLPNAHKQEVLTAARATWAAKMCTQGDDIAYVVIQTDSGEIVGRADPHSVFVL